MQMPSGSPRGSSKRNASWFAQPPGCSTAHAGTRRSRREPGTPALMSIGAASARRISTCAAFSAASGLVRPRCESIRDPRVGPPKAMHSISGSLRAAPNPMHWLCASFGTGPDGLEMCQVARVSHLEGCVCSRPRMRGLMLPQYRPAWVIERRAPVWIGVPRVKHAAVGDRSVPSGLATERGRAEQLDGTERFAAARLARTRLVGQRRRCLSDERLTEGVVAAARGSMQVHVASQ
jgi:hypothetical protein